MPARPRPLPALRATGSLGAEQLVVGDTLGLSHGAALASDYNGDGTGDVLFRNKRQRPAAVRQDECRDVHWLRLGDLRRQRYLYGGHGGVNGDGFADVVGTTAQSRHIKPTDERRPSPEGYVLKR
jgi:hypothetical protein